MHSFIVFFLKKIVFLNAALLEKKKKKDLFFSPVIQSLFYKVNFLTDMSQMCIIHVTQRSDLND